MLIRLQGTHPVSNYSLSTKANDDYEEMIGHPNLRWSSPELLEGESQENRAIYTLLLPLPHIFLSKLQEFPNGSTSLITMFVPSDHFVAWHLMNNFDSEIHRSISPTLSQTTLESRKTPYMVTGKAC